MGSISGFLYRLLVKGGMRGIRLLVNDEGGTRLLVGGTRRLLVVGRRPPRPRPRPPRSRPEGLDEERETWPLRRLELVFQSMSAKRKTYGDKGSVVTLRFEIMRPKHCRKVKVLLIDRSWKWAGYNGSHETKTEPTKSHDVKNTPKQVPLD